MPNNIILFVTINKFNPNLILISINKLKWYMIIEDKTLQLVLTKPSDLIAYELVQTKISKPLPIENEIFELVDFELVNVNLLKPPSK